MALTFVPHGDPDTAFFKAEATWRGSFALLAVAPESRSKLILRELSYTNDILGSWELETKWRIFATDMRRTTSALEVTCLCTDEDQRTLAFSIFSVPLSGGDLAKDEFQLKFMRPGLRSFFRDDGGYVLFFEENGTSKMVRVGRSQGRIEEYEFVIARTTQRSFTESLTLAVTSFGMTGNAFHQETRTRLLRARPVEGGSALLLFSVEQTDKEGMQLNLLLRSYLREHEGFIAKLELGQVRNISNIQLLVEGQIAVVLLATDNSSEMLMFKVGAQKLISAGQAVRLPTPSWDSAELSSKHLLLTYQNEIHCSNLGTYPTNDWEKCTLPRRTRVDPLSDWGDPKSEYFDLAVQCAPRPTVNAFLRKQQLGVPMAGDSAEAISGAHIAVLRGLRGPQFLEATRAMNSARKLQGVTSLREEAGSRQDSRLLLFSGGWGYVGVMDVAEEAPDEDDSELLKHARRVFQTLGVNRETIRFTLQKFPGAEMVEKLSAHLPRDARRDKFSTIYDFCADETELDRSVKNLVLGLAMKPFVVKTLEELLSVAFARQDVIERVLVFVSFFVRGKRFPRLEEALRKTIALRILLAEVSCDEYRRVYRHSSDPVRKAMNELRKETCQMFLDKDNGPGAINVLDLCLRLFRLKRWHAVKLLIRCVPEGETELAGFIEARAVIGSTLPMTESARQREQTVSRRPLELLEAFWKKLNGDSFSVATMSIRDQDFFLETLRDRFSRALKETSSSGSPEPDLVRLAYCEFAAQVLEPAPDLIVSAGPWYERISELATKLSNATDIEAKKSYYKKLMVGYLQVRLKTVLAMSEFTEAQSIIKLISNANTTPAAELDAANSFAQAIFEEGDYSWIIEGTDWGDQEGLIEKVLKESSSRSLPTIEAHEVLWGFYFHRGKYRKAAEAAYLRLRKLRRKKHDSTRTVNQSLELQLTFLVDTMNALAMLPPDLQWLVKGSSNSYEIRTLDDLKKLYQVLSGWMEVVLNISVTREDINADTKENSEKLMNALVDLSRYKVALAVGITCGLELDLVFECFVEWIYSYKHQEELTSRNTTLRLSYEKLLWEDLGQFLNLARESNGGHRYPLFVARQILSHCRDDESVPDFLVDKILDLGGVNALVRLLCDSGRPFEAVTLLKECLGKPDLHVAHHAVALCAGYLEEEVVRQHTDKGSASAKELLGELVALYAKKMETDGKEEAGRRMEIDVARNAGGLPPSNSFLFA